MHRRQNSVPLVKWKSDLRLDDVHWAGHLGTTAIPYWGTPILLLGPCCRQCLLSREHLDKLTVKYLTYSAEHLSQTYEVQWVK